MNLRIVLRISCDAHRAMRICFGHFLLVVSPATRKLPQNGCNVRVPDTSAPPEIDAAAERPRFIMRQARGQNRNR